MALRLKSIKTVPKNGFVYVQPETGRPMGGMYSFSYVVNEMVAHRKGNNLPRANKAEASIDLENYTINLHPELAYDPGYIVQERVTAGCASCGIKTL